MGIFDDAFAAFAEIPEFFAGLASGQVDYECELVVVIGKACKNVPRARALEYVLGYTCGNDVSARDWQRDWGGSQWCRGKSFDTFGPLGPRLVTADEIPNPNALKISTTVSGAKLQDWNTDDMIFDVRAIVHHLSQYVTLEPGDLILTGTPQGVAFGGKFPYLRAGDVVDIEIEGLGRQRQAFVAWEAQR